MKKMNNKSDSWNMKCVLIVLLSLAIYCTTSSLVKQLDFRKQTINSPTEDVGKKLQITKNIPPKYMNRRTWNILRSILKATDALNINLTNINVTNMKYVTPIPKIRPPRKNKNKVNKTSTPNFNLNSK